MEDNVENKDFTNLELEIEDRGHGMQERGGC